MAERDLADNLAVYPLLYSRCVLLGGLGGATWSLGVGVAARPETRWVPGERACVSCSAPGH